MESIEISARKPYRIYIGDKTLENLPGLLEDTLPDRTGHRPGVFVVTDRNVAHLYLEKVIEGLGKKGFKTGHTVLPPGEDTKSFRALRRLLTYMARAGLGRDDVLVGLGGGVIGDLAGFAASVYMRGCTHIMIPTTLLAQVDSSIGGKTGINIKEGKNLVGSFKSPLFVLIDTETLNTLDGRQWVCGLAEIIKCGLIRSRELFEIVEQVTRDAADDSDGTVTGLSLKTHLCQPRQKSRTLLGEIIGKAVKIKREIVAEDELEQDLRRLLNFGHTFGHALENLLRYRTLLHGEAVILGMRIAVELSKSLDLLSGNESDRIKRLLNALPVPRVKKAVTRGVYGRLTRDKKRREGKTVYVLLKRIGEGVILSDVDRRSVHESIDAGLQR
jgi:3-dehydroquinate synthase